MAIQPMALSVANPEMNALQGFAQGQQARQTAENNSLVNAKQAIQNIGSLAFGVMGGKLDGQADPQRWEEALDMLGQSGMNVEAFRGRADLAPIVAKASADTLGQLNLNLNERELEQRVKEFGLKVMEAAKGPAPTAEMRNYDWAQGDPARMQFLGKGPDGKPPAIVETYDPETGRPIKGYMEGTTFVPVGGVKAPSSPLVTVNTGDGAPGLGKLSTDYGYVLDPATGQPVIDPATGLPKAAAVPGSPAAIAAQREQDQATQRRTQTGRYSDIVLEDVDRALGLTGSDTTGILGTLLQKVPGSNARNLDSLLSTVRANIGFDRLQAMRDMSPTGGALGQVSEFENRLLQATLGNLEQSQSEAQLRQNLERLRDVYLDIIHGPGNRPEAEATSSPAGGSSGNIDYSADAPPEGWGGNPELWQFMSPEDRALWK